ncbi:MAG: SWIM zinc finger family protein, partial [Armatimonadota bacterium]|nr:SWIM zinc finger family protein [Armatimonadota bacterium]
MTQTPSLNVAQVQAIAGPETYNRGEYYFESGAVQNLIRRGSRLEAEVQGSDDDPYSVTVEMGEKGIDGYSCSCPYDRGGACKHVVAVLIAAIHAPQEIEERPPLDTLLAGLDRDQLK